MDTPKHQKDFDINQHGRWYTWSQEIRPFLRSWNQYVKTIEKPKLKSLNEAKPYVYTYSQNLSKIKEPQLCKELASIATALNNLPVDDRILFFTGLLQDLDGVGLHFLFASLREALVQIRKDPLSGLYSPLDPRGSKDFPLHCDLYVPKILFNVYEDVPTDSSGASIFMSTQALKKILSNIRYLSIKNQNAILHSLSKESRRDRYDRFYDLLHGRHVWKDQLEEEMQKHQQRIKLDAGQGYMLHDRLWLHGREKVIGKIPRNRLHRLVFNNKSVN
ncbi:hypothetical protein [Nitrososphaera viennensis]|uniref:TauD/TfdA-like domain-containing protein n=2 Tax=Nitrososphaera viennensis TaxID=1034015 RepID=A0A060HJZ1_9ARCH|nr:hypothetical protein [Nitrososphaera viennensis]AIC15828.1 hypothetical protein NVIE_015770 [Nitrososphaera viennensis EN76]UVS67819.1 hypothetical protein NWT39_07855 [Nitrososphaera viennensis]